MKGGERTGAGRKPSPDKMKRVLICIPPPLLLWLDEQPGSRGELIRKLLIAKKERRDK